MHNPPRQQPTLKREFFVYGIEFLGLAAGATATNIIPIQADAEFECLKLCYASDLAAGVQTESTRTIPQCEILITDSGSDKQLMNMAVDFTTLFGSGSEPFILPVPKRFRRNGGINIALSNYSAAQVYNIRLSFIGCKLWSM